MNESGPLTNLAWFPETLRLSVFFAPRHQEEDHHSLWQRVMGSQPESQEHRPHQGIYQEHGAVHGNQLFFAAQKDRMDWTVLPGPPAAEGGIATLGSVGQMVELLHRALAVSLEAGRAVDRLALGVSLLKEAGDNADAVNFLSRYMSNVIQGSPTDFAYQVNRRRRSERVPHASVNRLAKWTVEAVQSGSFRVGPPSAPVFVSSSTRVVSKVVLDINTIPGDPAISLKQLPALFEEFVEWASEIADRGDIRMTIGAFTALPRLDEELLQLHGYYQETNSVSLADEGSLSEYGLEVINITSLDWSGCWRSGFVTGLASNLGAWRTTALFLGCSTLSLIRQNHHICRARIRAVGNYSTKLLYSAIFRCPRKSAWPINTGASSSQEPPHGGPRPARPARSSPNLNLTASQSTDVSSDDIPPQLSAATHRVIPVLRPNIPPVSPANLPSVEPTAVVEWLKASARLELVDEVTELLRESSEEPFEPPIGVEVLWQMAQFFVERHPDFDDPVIGSDRHGGVLAQWRIYDSGVLVIAFLGNGEVLLVASAWDGEKRLSISERGLEGDIIERHGYLVPCR